MNPASTVVILDDVENHGDRIGRRYRANQIRARICVVSSAGPRARGLRTGIQVVRALQEL